jgi:hypothetical protein
MADPKVKQDKTGAENDRTVKENFEKGQRGIDDSSRPVPAPSKSPSDWKGDIFDPRTASETIRK